MSDLASCRHIYSLMRYSADARITCSLHTLQNYKKLCAPGIKHLIELQTSFLSDGLVDFLGEIKMCSKANNSLKFFAIDRRHEFQTTLRVLCTDENS